jgi:protein arginine N-methyltransferase 5
MNCTIHGFSGTFHCVLYKDVCISIVPESHSPHMFSWFPLFIPLTVPLRVNKSDIITVNIWRYGRAMALSRFLSYLSSFPVLLNGLLFVISISRHVNSQKVWYEWNITSPTVTAIQNCNGLSYWIGL